MGVGFWTRVLEGSGRAVGGVVGGGGGTKGMADQQMGGFDADVAVSINGATPAGGRFANLGAEYLFIFYE